MNFNGKKIMVISPYFFDYQNRMRNELEDRGAIVDLVDERPSNSFISKVCIRLNIKWFYPIINSYYKKLTKKYKGEYDYILFIKCQAPTIKALKLISKTYPNAKKILYLYDSIKNTKGIEDKFELFDSVISFDPQDVSKHSFMKYAYWGFTKEFYYPKVNNSEMEYDLAFIGTMHTLRPKVLSSIEKQCSQLGLRLFTYKYAPHPLVFLYSKLTNFNFRNIRLREVHFSSLTSNEMIKIYKTSRAVLEIECPTQSGATTRLGEMIGMHKKLITTYQGCCNEDCYRDNNIYILDTENIIIDNSFFESEYEELPDEVYNAYSFETFLQKVFE